MKYLTVSALFLIFLASCIPAFSADYKTLGDAQVAQYEQAINIVVAVYKKNIYYMNLLQQQQFTSQYASLLATLHRIKANLDKDSGVNLQNDYTAIDEGTYLYEAKLPELYSEILLYKAVYLNAKMGKTYSTLVPSLIQQIPPSEHQEALNISNEMAGDMTAISNDTIAITNDYSAIADAQDTKATTQFKGFLLDIAHQQTDLYNHAKQFVNDLNQLASLV